MPKETTQNGTKKPKGFQPGNTYGKKITSENQPSPEAKRRGWLKKKTIDEYAELIKEEAFGQVYEKLKNGEFTNKELLEAFRQAVDMSGQKSQKQEVEFSNNLKINVITKGD